MLTHCQDKSLQLQPRVGWVGLVERDYLNIIIPIWCMSYVMTGIKLLSSRDLRNHFHTPKERMDQKHKVQNSQTREVCGQKLKDLILSQHGLIIHLLFFYPNPRRFSPSALSLYTRGQVFLREIQSTEFLIHSHTLKYIRITTEWLLICKRLPEPVSSLGLENCAVFILNSFILFIG